MFRTQVPPDRGDQFDYLDEATTLTVAIRMGHTGIIASLQDCGAMQAGESPIFTAANQLDLHPIQFWEVASFALYLSTLFDKVPKLLVTDDGTHLNIRTNNGPSTNAHLSGSGFDLAPVYRPFEPHDYAQVLASRLDLPVEAVWNDGGLWTCLYGPSEVITPWPLDQPRPVRAGI